MKLIDADALKQECMYIDDIPAVTEHDIDNAPTIAAIPVEWLRGLMIEYANINTPEHAAYAYCLNNVIEEWQKEQEAR